MRDLLPPLAYLLPPPKDSDILTQLVLAFDTSELRTLCEKGAIAEEELGADLSRALQARLLDLRAATTVGDLIAMGVLAVQGNGDQNVELRHGHRLILRANHPTPPMTPSGSIDWTRVRRIKLMRIEVPHGE